ncbi:hypothetical protein Emag_004923 [Eimeria magna]
MNETSRHDLGDEIRGDANTAGSANISSDADSQEEDAAQVRHLESSKQGDARPDEVSDVKKQSATTAGRDGLSVVSGTAEEAEESGEAAFPGCAAGREATNCGQFNEIQTLQEAGTGDSVGSGTCGEPAAGEAVSISNSTNFDSPMLALDAPPLTCFKASALPPGSVVGAQASESCEESDAIISGVSLEETGESREPSENFLSASEPTNTESSWFTGLMPVPALEPEERGMATVVSTVESWLTSAFGGQEAKDKKENVVNLGNEDLATAISGSSSTLDSPRTNGPPNLVPTEDERIGRSAHVEVESPAQAQTPTCSSASSDFNSSPRILLHLYEQPEPILWSASECVSQRACTREGFDESGHSQEDDSRYLHVPLPRLLADAEGAVEPATPRRSLDQLAADLERWILDGPRGSAEAQDMADGSVCSSESDEDTGERTFDLARVTAFFLGNVEANQAIGAVGDNMDPSHKAMSALQPLHDSTSRTHASSLAVSPRGPGLTTTGSHLLPTDPPSAVSKEAVAPTELAARGPYSSAFRTSDKTESPLAMPNLQTYEGHVAEGNGEADDAAESAAGSDTTADECDTLWHTPGYDRSPEARELTTEEAEAKEASIRSIGNRIWAFFGGTTGAEDAPSGSGGPTSSDAVEETIQFEDPAVVQRDDHRAFPNETQLLLESIKQNPQLQVLSPQQQKYLASLMRREVVAASTTVAEEGAEAALMWAFSEFL